MPIDHSQLRLKANSPQVGERCPVSGIAFEPGDEMVVCQQSGVAFSAKHWSEAISMWGDRCPYCDSRLATPATPSHSGIKLGRPPRQQMSMSIWAIAGSGIGLLVCGVIIGALVISGVFLQDSEPETGSIPASTSIPSGQIAANSPTPTSTLARIPTAPRTLTPTQRPTATSTPTKTPDPQVFSNIKGGEICNCSCSVSGVKVYDFGTQVRFCFQSNFSTDVEATLYDPRRTPYPLGNWFLDKKEQCTQQLPLPHDPKLKGAWELVIVGFDSPNGNVSNRHTFCLDECRGCN